MKVDGHCHCGAIAYEGELDPADVGICHCTDCQSLSASAFRTIAVIPAASFRLTRGKPKEYIKTGDSGRRRVQAFCPECGSGLYATDADSEPQAFNIRAGTLSQRFDLRPVFECWRQSAMPWLPEIPGTKKFDTNP
jgi:hypothetical protein